MEIKTVIPAFAGMTRISLSDPFTRRRIKMMHFVRSRRRVNRAAHGRGGLVFVDPDDDAFVIQQRIDQTFGAQKLDGFDFERPAFARICTDIQMFWTDAQNLSRFAIRRGCQQIHGR